MTLRTPQVWFQSYSLSLDMNSHASVISSSEIRPYMFETLMCLVDVHSQVSSAAESVLHRVLNALVEVLALEALKSIRQIERFGMGGMLCVGFLHALILPVGNDLLLTGHA